MSSRVQLIVPSPTASTITNRTPIKEEVEVCVIGMGFSGMAITYNLRKNGFHWDAVIARTRRRTSNFETSTQYAIRTITIASIHFEQDNLLNRL